MLGAKGLEGFVGPLHLGLQILELPRQPFFGLLGGDKTDLQALLDIGRGQGIRYLSGEFRVV